MVGIIFLTKNFVVGESTHKLEGMNGSNGNTHFQFEYNTTSEEHLLISFNFGKTLSRTMNIAVERVEIKRTFGVCYFGGISAA